MDRGAWWAIYSPWGHKELDMTEWPTLSLFMTHFKLILVKGIYTVSSRLIFFQHHLLKTLSFLHCIVCFPSFFWSNISWWYLCGSDSSLSILYWFICLFFHQGTLSPLLWLYSQHGSWGVSQSFSFCSPSILGLLQETLESVCQYVCGCSLSILLVMNGCWILLNAFFCICWCDCMNFFLQLVNEVYDIIWFSVLNHTWEIPLGQSV